MKYLELIKESNLTLHQLGNESLIKKGIYDLTIDKLPTKNDLSNKISNDLKQKGMKYVGSVIIYSYLQAIGIICSHEEECFMCYTK